MTTEKPGVTQKPTPRGVGLPGFRDIVNQTDVSDIAPPRVRGRAKGSKREARSIRRVRTAMALLLEKNADQYQDWLQRAAEKDPMKALALMVALAEYYMPKLGRIEQTGTVEHKVSHFVPVTEREAAPVLAGPSPVEGEFTEVKS